MIVPTAQGKQGGTQGVLKSCQNTGNLVCSSNKFPDSNDTGFGCPNGWPLAASEGWPLVRGNYKENTLGATVFWPHKRGEKVQAHTTTSPRGISQIEHL